MCSVRRASARALGFAIRLKRLSCRRSVQSAPRCAPRLDGGSDGDRSIDLFTSMEAEIKLYCPLALPSTRSAPPLASRIKVAFIN